MRRGPARGADATACSLQDKLPAASTAVYAHLKGWAVVIPPEAWAGGLAAALLIGAVAGLLPAVRAARLSPTEALWTV
jgi:putative ABC transport system permease protein